MLFDIRADIGTALTPALPISGFIFFDSGRKRFRIFTNITPEHVATTNAQAPRKKINIEK